MNRYDKIAADIMSHLLDDYGVTNALTKLVKPHITTVKKLFDAGDTGALGSYYYNKEGKLGDLPGIKKSPENKFIMDIGYKILFAEGNGNCWSLVGYNPLSKYILLQYDILAAVNCLTTCPQYNDIFKRDIARFDVSIRHEVTHAIRDAHTHHIKKFMERSKTDKKLVQEYNEHGHQDFEFEIDAIINSFDRLRKKIGVVRYNKLDEAGFENLLPGLRFPRVGNPARKVWMRRLEREGLLPDKMLHGGKIVASICSGNKT